MAQRQHQVPRGYLNRFGDDGAVLVRWRDGKVYRTGTRAVAVECGFYDLPDGHGGTWSGVEALLADADGAAVTAMRSIDASGLPPATGSEERGAMSEFIALQMTRTTAKREQAMFPERYASWAGDRPLTQELVAEYLEREHLGFTPTDGEARGAWILLTKALEDGPAETRFAIELMMQMVFALVPRLDAMHWTLEEDRKGRLITSDTPAVLWRTPSKRDEVEGIGIDNTDEIRFPLDPHKQLVLSKRLRTATARITPERVRSCNADMANACHRFLVAHPAQLTQIESLRLTARHAVIRFNTGPMFVPNEGGGGYRRKAGSEVLQVWHPRGSHVATQPRRR